MNQIVKKLEKIPQFKNLLRKTCKYNQLPITILNGFSCDKIKAIYGRILKHYEEHNLKGKTLWFQNQLKIFFWILIIWSLVQNKLINEFDDNDWGQIKLIFTIKDIYTFKYEAKRIMLTGRKNSRVWNHQQNQHLQTIMNDSEIKNRWNQVARMFYQLSDHKYFRTGKQCRQHWLNHLDSSKKHGKWSRQQDQIILKYVFQNGKKWSYISKDILLHRTQHMIKNRFKSLIFKQKKKNLLNYSDQLKIVRKILRNCNSLQNNLGAEVINQVQENSKPQHNQSPETQRKDFTYKCELPICPPLNNIEFPFHSQCFGIQQNYVNFYHFGYPECIFPLQSNTFIYAGSHDEEIMQKYENQYACQNIQFSRHSNFVWAKNQNTGMYYITNQL